MDTYQSIPAFGLTGKIIVDSAPRGSGRNSQLSPQANAFSNSGANAVPLPQQTPPSSGSNTGSGPWEQGHWETVTVCINGSSSTRRVWMQ
jgi:hypothetical protein